MADRGWGTEREIRFLKGLGTWRPGHPGNHGELLRRYKGAFWKRKNWGSIDRGKVLSWLDRQVKEP